jgi:hypothetical protein
MTGLKEEHAANLATSLAEIANILNARQSSGSESRLTTSILAEIGNVQRYLEKTPQTTFLETHGSAMGDLANWVDALTHLLSEIVHFVQHPSCGPYNNGHGGGKLQS